MGFVVCLRGWGLTVARLFRVSFGRAINAPPPLGLYWAILGPSWGPLGLFLAPCWALLGFPWGPLQTPTPIRELATIAGQTWVNMAAGNGFRKGEALGKGGGSSEGGPWHGEALGGERLRKNLQLAQPYSSLF